MLRKFFCSGTIWPPMALISGKNSAKNGRFLRKTVEYSQLVTWKILFALSSTQYWIFRRRAGSGDHFCSRALTIYMSFSDYETVAKVLGGKGERSLGEHKVRPYVKNIHLIEEWYYHNSPALP